MVNHLVLERGSCFSIEDFHGENFLDEGGKLALLARSGCSVPSRNDHELLVDEAILMKPADLIQHIAHNFFVSLIAELFQDNPPEGIDREFSHLHVIEQDTPDVATVDNVELMEVLAVELKRLRCHEYTTVSTIVRIDKAVDGRAIFRLAKLRVKFSLLLHGKLSSDNVMRPQRPFNKDILENHAGFVLLVEPNHDIDAL